jgi:hypothetical protein
MKIRRSTAVRGAYDLRESALFAGASPPTRTGPPRVVIVRRKLKIGDCHRDLKCGRQERKPPPAVRCRRIVGLAANHQVLGGLLEKVKQKLKFELLCNFL